MTTVISRELKVFPVVPIKIRTGYFGTEGMIMVLIHVVPVSGRGLHVSVICHNLKPQSHIYGFGPGRATVHPDLSNRGASA